MSSNHLIDSAYDCDAVIDLIPEFAFGLTTPEESRLVESGLASCPEAASQLADFQHLQGEMLAGVQQIEPPYDLEDRLVAAIVLPTTAVKPPRRRFSLAWLAAAAAVLALILTNVYWLGRVNGLSQPPPAGQDQAAQIRIQGDNTFVLTSESDLHWVRLPPSQQNTNASAFLLWNAESEIGLMYARGFPKLAAGETYQLWLTRGDERVSAGTFRVDADGNAALLFHITSPIDRYTWARITAEPENGSPQPSDTAVVVGQL